MDFEERIAWLLVGMVLGFIAGYIVRALREIKEKLDETKEELDEVDDIVKRKLRDDAGFISNQVAMLVALGLVLLSVIFTIRAAHTARDAADKSDAITKCSVQFLSKTITALNERTTYTTSQAESNVKLQKSQADFFALLLRKPPESVAVRTDAAQTYLSSLNSFVEVSGKNVRTLEANPYPTNHELQVCLSK